MAVATILNFEKRLPFLYYLTDYRQIMCKYCDVDLELVDDVGNAVAKIQNDGRRHLGFRKSTAITLLFDRSSPKLVETLGLPLGTYR